MKLNWTLNNDQSFLYINTNKCIVFILNVLISIFCMPQMDREAFPTHQVISVVGCKLQ